MRTNLLNEFFLVCLAAGIPWVLLHDMAPNGVVLGVGANKTLPGFVGLACLARLVCLLAIRDRHVKR